MTEIRGRHVSHRGWGLLHGNHLPDYDHVVNKFKFAARAASRDQLDKHRAHPQFMAPHHQQRPHHPTMPR